MYWSLPFGVRVCDAFELLDLGAMERAFAFLKNQHSVVAQAFNSSTLEAEVEAEAGRFLSSRLFS